jgi:hypothetical protein
MCPTPTAHYSRDEKGFIVCSKPCRYCIMEFIMKRLVARIFIVYKRFKKIKTQSMNFRNLRDREILGKITYKGLRD